MEDRVAGFEKQGLTIIWLTPLISVNLSHISVLLSRRSTSGLSDSDELRIGSIVMDLTSHAIRRADTPLVDRAVGICSEFFMRHPNQTLSRAEILDYAWSYDSQVKPELVDVYVSYLRQKLTISGKKIPSKPSGDLGISWKKPMLKDSDFN